MKLYFWVGFSLSLVCAVLKGLDFAFNVYALALKETFNMTQSQVEMTACMGSLGFMMGYVQPMLRQGFGLTVVLAVSWILTTGSLALYSISSYYNMFTRNYPIIVYIVQFLTTVGLYISYISITGVCLENIQRKHLGKLVGLYFALVASGKFFFAGLYEVFFFEDLGGFFMVTCCLAFVFIGLSSFFLTIMDSEKDSSVAFANLDDSKHGIGTQDQSEVKISDMLLSANFHRFFWPTSLSFGMTTSMINNITSVAQSANLSDPLITVYVASVSITILRIVSGLIFDKAASELMGFVLLFVGYICFISSLVLVLVDLSESTVIIAAVLVGVFHGIHFSISVTILVLKFGQNKYPTITSLYKFVGGASVILFQLITGFLYDERKDPSASNNICYGIMCFYWQFVMFLIITSVLLIWQLIDFIIRIKYLIQTNGVR